MSPIKSPCFASRMIRRTSQPIFGPGAEVPSRSVQNICLGFSRGETVPEPGNPRASRTQTAFAIAAGLSMWLIYVGLVGYFGVIKNATMRPPGIAFIFVPVLAFLVLSILRLRSSAGARVALAFPLWIILGTQSFRIVVELFLHQLWIDGLVPKMLTFASANVDIYWSVSAPDRLVVDTGAHWD
jgi:hypothetical protein